MIARTNRRTLFVVAFCLLFLNRIAPAVLAEDDKRDIKVMTRNMDAGTDLQWFFVIPDVTTAAAVTFNEVLASNIPGRAGLLAREIASQQPDLIALQEVSLWEAGPLGGAPTTVLDQLQLLIDALADRHLRYAPVVINTLTSVAAPISPTQLVRFTDRDVILVRSDMEDSDKDSDIDDAGHPPIRLSNVQKHIYQAKFGFPLGGGVVPVLRGWVSVDVKVRGKVFRFVDTHLESPIPGVPQATTVQVAQVDELLLALRTTALPVVLAGDLNANAEPGSDHTPTTDHILAAGYMDAWRIFNPPGTGFTWPLFLEDFAAGTPVHPFERIDLIYARFLNVRRVEQTGLAGPWPSDHAGTAATVAP